MTIQNPEASGQPKVPHQTMTDEAYLKMHPEAITDPKMARDMASVTKVMEEQLLEYAENLRNAINSGDLYRAGEILKTMRAERQHIDDKIKKAELMLREARQLIQGYSDKPEGE